MKTKVSKKELERKMCEIPPEAIKALMVPKQLLKKALKILNEK